jgi:hypothetical protein
MSLFLEALVGGMVATLLVVLLWRLAQRVGLAMPRARTARRKLLCVRPLDFDA